MSEERPVFYRYIDTMDGDPARLRVWEERWIGIARTRKSWWVVPEACSGPGWTVEVLKGIRKRVEDGGERISDTHVPAKRWAYRDKRDAVWSYGQRKAFQRAHAERALLQSSLGAKAAREALERLREGKEPFEPGAQWTAPLFSEKPEAAE